MGTALLGFLALTWTSASQRLSRRERLWPAPGQVGRGSSRDSPAPPDDGAVQPVAPDDGAVQPVAPVGGAAALAPLADRPALAVVQPATPIGPLAFTPVQAVPPASRPALTPVHSGPTGARPVLTPIGSTDRRRPAPQLPGTAAQQLAVWQSRRAELRQALLARAAPAADQAETYLVGLLLAGTEQPRKATGGEGRQPHPAAALQTGRRPAPAPQSPPPAGIPPEFRRQAAFSHQPTEPPWRFGPLQGSPPGEAFPGPGTPSPSVVPGAASVSPVGAQRSWTSLELLREQLAQILKDDALRHGINLKE